LFVDERLRESRQASNSEFQNRAARSEDLFGKIGGHLLEVHANESPPPFVSVSGKRDFAGQRQRLRKGRHIQLIVSRDNTPARKTRQFGAICTISGNLCLYATAWWSRQNCTTKAASRACAHKHPKTRPLSLKAFPPLLQTAPVLPPAIFNRPLNPPRSRLDQSRLQSRPNARPQVGGRADLLAQAVDRAAHGQLD
jgi:hypothetical protein